MGPRAGHEITELLSRAQAGDPNAADELLPLVYGELRKLAKSRMHREKPGQTLQATGLVHEAYLRLVGNEELTWDGRGHFFSATAEAMRRILIERARRKSRLRHGGDFRRTTLETGVAAFDDAGEELLDLDRALSRLEAADPEMADIVKLRYFAGLTVDETAAALGVSASTVNRHWLAAKTWLQGELTDTADPG